MEKMAPFVDTHAHLMRNCDLKVFDKIAEDGIIEKVFLLPFDIYDPKYNFAPGEQVLEVCRIYPQLFVPFAFIDYNGDASQVDRFAEQGYKALKASRPPKDYDDDSYLPIYERAEALGMPVLFHVGIISKKKREDVHNGGSLGPTHMRPSMLDTIAAACPKIRLIQGHMGIPWVDELFESLYYYENISCSVSGLVDYDWLIHNLNRTAFNKVPFTQKMMFSCDAQYGTSGSYEAVLKRAEFMRMFFHFVGGTYEWGSTAEDFMGNNAKRIFPEFF